MKPFFTGCHWLDSTVATWEAFAPKSFYFPRDTESFLLGTSKVTRHKVLQSRVVALNETGQEKLDEAVIEWNSFSNDAQDSRQFGSALSAVLETLCAKNDWDEFRLGGIHEDLMPSVYLAAKRFGLHVHTYAQKPSYYLDLNNIRDVYKADVMKFFSANTREQLRRAKKEIEKQLGALNIVECDSHDDIGPWLEETANLHRKRWSSGEKSNKAYSGFDNPSFTYFHQQLSQRTFADKQLQLLRLEAQARPIAYLYNFLYEGVCYFYLSGIDYSLPEKCRPGLVAHWYAINHNIALGTSRYDFLAGENRYKRSLSSNQYQQFWVYLQRPRVKLVLEQMARKLKNLKSY